MSAYVLANSYSLMANSPMHRQELESGALLSARSPLYSPRPASATLRPVHARDTYTPLLTTVHMRHAMMKERIEQRWKEVNAQLRHMRREIRQRTLAPHSAASPLLEGEERGGQAAGGMDATRQAMALVANAMVEELRAGASRSAIGERVVDVLKVHSDEDEGAESKQQEKTAADDGATASDGGGDRRKDRVRDAVSSSGNEFGLQEAADDDNSDDDTAADSRSDADIYEQHAARWQKQTLQPIFVPNTDPLSPKAVASRPMTASDSLASASSASTSSSASVLPSSPPLTPRHSYSVHLSSTIKNLVALLMQLDKAAMSSIRASFQHHPHGLTLYSYLLIAMTYMRSCVGSREDIAALIEMFRDIDVNGDQVMEWEEFTSHLVQLASTYGEDTTSSQLPHFTASSTEDTSTHDRVCDLVRYVPALKRLVVFERNSRRYKVYSTDMKALAVVRGHRAALLCCEYWEKGGMLLTASADKQLIFWQPAPNHQFVMSMSWTLPASYVQLRYAGHHTLFAADTNHSIVQWHLERSEQRAVYVGHTDVVMDMAVLSNVNLLASCSLDTTVRLWDIAKQHEVSIMKGHSKPATLLAYHADLKLLISAGMDRFALVWNPRVLAPVYTIQCASPLAHVIGLEVLSGSAELVIGDSRGSFMVYDLRSFSVIQQFSIPNLTLEQSLHSFTVVHSAGVLVAAGSRLYQFKRTTGVRRHHADDNAVRYAAFNATRLTFITVASDNIKVWNALTGMLEREEKNFTRSAITSVCCDEHQRRIYVGCTDGSVYCLNYSSGAIMCQLPIHRTEVSSLCYHAANKSVVSGSWDASVCLTDDKLLAVTKRSAHHSEDVLLLASSTAFSLIASAAADLTVSLHDTHLGPPLCKWQLAQLPAALLFLDPYPLLLVADHAGGLTLLDVTPPWRRTPLASIAAFSRVSISLGLPLGHSRVRAEGEAPIGGGAWEVNGGGDGSRTSVVNAMCFNSSTDTLYTGDDAGYIKGWRLDDSLLRPFQERRRKRLRQRTRRGSVADGGRQTEGEGKRAAHPLLAQQRHSIMEGSRAVSSQSKTRSILKAHDGAADERKEGREDERKVRIEDDRRDEVRLPPHDHTLSDRLWNVQVGDEEEEDDDAAHPIIQADDVKLLTPELLATLTPLLSPHLLVHAHDDSCSGLSILPLSLPAPALLSYSFDGSVVLSCTHTGLHLGSLMQGHNARTDEREGGRGWNLQLDLLRHRARELEMMREGLRGRSGGDVGWVREAREEEEEQAEDDEAEAARGDMRLKTPLRTRKELESKEKQADPSALLPPIHGHAQHLNPSPAALQPSAHLEYLPALPHHKPQGRLVVGHSALQLSEQQTAAVERMERVMRGGAVSGEAAESGEQETRGAARRVRGEIDESIVREFGHWGEGRQVGRTGGSTDRSKGGGEWQLAEEEEKVEELQQVVR